MTPVYRQNYRIGLPFKASWKEIFNSDDVEFFGSGKLNKQVSLPEAVKADGRDYSILINIAPLGAMVLKTI